MLGTEFQRVFERLFLSLSIVNLVVRPINSSDHVIRTNIGSFVTHVPRFSDRFCSLVS